MKIINRLKWKRANVDKIRPFKVYAILGIIFDPLFTIQFLMLSVFYFFKTRIQARSTRLFGVKNTLNLLSQERNLFLDLDREARQTLAEDPTMHTIVFGHTHLPMHRVYKNGRQYLNTGTWTRMVYLDWRFIGDPFRRTFALIRLKDGVVRAELNEWNGLKTPYQSYWG